MKQSRLMWVFAALLVVVCLPQLASAQCSNSPTATPSATATATPTPAATPTPFASAWLTINPPSSWLTSTSMPGYYQEYFITVNKAPFDVTFTFGFMGDNASAFIAQFPNYPTACSQNTDGSVTIKQSHGCPWWIFTDEFGVDTTYIETTSVADPGSPYSIKVSH